MKKRIIISMELNELDYNLMKTLYRLITIYYPDVKRLLIEIVKESYVEIKYYE